MLHLKVNLKGRERATWLSGKNIPSSTNSKPKGLEAAACLPSSKNSRETSTAGAEQTRGEWWEGKPEKWTWRAAGGKLQRASKARDGLWLLLRWGHFEQRSNAPQLAF